MTRKQHAHIELLGTPIAKIRHRSAGRYPYDPQHRDKIGTRKQIASLYNGTLMTGPVSVNLYAWHPMPKSWSKKKCAEQVSCPYTGKKDLDNIIKYYLDCMTGIVYKDDRQIYRLKGLAVWTDGDGVVTLTVEES